MRILVSENALTGLNVAGRVCQHVGCTNQQGCGTVIFNFECTSQKNLSSSWPPAITLIQHSEISTQPVPTASSFHPYQSILFTRPSSIDSGLNPLQSPPHTTVSNQHPSINLFAQLPKRSRSFLALYTSSNRQTKPLKLISPSSHQIHNTKQWPAFSTPAARPTTSPNLPFSILNHLHP
jgi:hypothetical protein